MHCSLMFVSHFFAGPSFVVVVLDKFFSFRKQKSGRYRIRQVVVLYGNNCMGICLGGLSIGRLRQVAVLQRWLFELV